MAIKSLAVKYRPTTFSDVKEQGSIKVILEQQLESNTTKNAYLFCGGAGTGKTTCARIFAGEINKHQGNPIEMDAASNSSVDDVREIIAQAKTKSLDSEYKVFIIDECHSLSNTAWQSFLKLIEEPPAKSIFIFCTTDPQKIPKTILSRVQRYDFQRISVTGIKNRLEDICDSENRSISSNEKSDFISYDSLSLEYIAKLADGGMRDAITLLDKVISFSKSVTLENVTKALGVVDYKVMCTLTDAIINSHNKSAVIKIIEEVHRSGKDLKQFIKSYMNFVLDVNKYNCLKSFDYLEVPPTYESDFKELFTNVDLCNSLLGTLIKLNSEIKWETAPKSMIEASLILQCEEK